MASALNICFMKEAVHEIAKSKYEHLSERLIKLNNYDHVTADLFAKLKVELDDPSLSRFKKPVPKICLACWNQKTMNVTSLQLYRNPLTKIRFTNC